MLARLWRLVSLVRRATAEPGSSGYPVGIIVPKFWEPNFWEPAVQLALRDYCRPGDIAFDIGANAGALSLVMSRHVGPKGVVCAFEASPRIIGTTHHNLVHGGCTNVQLFYRAVYHTSHQFVTLYPGNHLNDSIYNNLGAENGASYRVETLALDDFVNATGLMPRVIKMDIEGAEFDALQGGLQMLRRGKPVLILEQSPSDMRCQALLTELGYKAVDLANYRHIRTVEDFDPGITIANLLYVHGDQAADDVYLNAGAPVEVARLTPDMFTYRPDGSLSLTDQIELPPGRYACIADFTADGTNNEIFAGVDTERGRIQRYHTYTRLMAETYRDWVFHLASPTKVSPFIEFVHGSDATLRWGGAVIYRYPGFDSHAPAVVF